MHANPGQVEARKVTASRSRALKADQTALAAHSFRQKRCTCWPPAPPGAKHEHKAASMHGTAKHLSGCLPCSCLALPLPLPGLVCYRHSSHQLTYLICLSVTLAWSRSPWSAHRHTSAQPSARRQAPAPKLVTSNRSACYRRSLFLNPCHRTHCAGRPTARPLRSEMAAGGPAQA